MTVDEPAAAAVFGSSRLRRLLMLFADGPLSLSEAAVRGNVELKRLHHHAGRLTKVGLLEVCGQRSRAGRPIKLYRAVSDAFFIPEELFPRPFGDELTAELRQCLATESSRSSRGLLLTVGPDGEPLGRVVKGRAGPERSFELWRVLRLSPDDLARLRSEIDSVFRKFQSQSAGPTHVYLLHAAVARRKDQSGSIDNPK